MYRVRSISNDAFWERSGFGGDGNSEVKLAHSGVIPGWVTFGEASRQVAPESKTVRGDSRNGQYRYSVGPVCYKWYQSLSSAGSVPTRTSDSKGGGM